MTVINMMSFGESGAAIADEQSSTQLRKYNVAQKIHIIEDSLIFGGSGPSDMIKEVYDEILKCVKDAKKSERDVSNNEIYEATKKIIPHIKNQKKSETLLNNIGISLDEFLIGMKERPNQLDEHIKRKALEIINDFNRQGMFGILFGSIEEGKFEISYAASDGSSSKNIPRCYGSIGTGSDESDRVLSQYVVSMPREKREKIPVDEGIVKLIEATNGSSNLNPGVGGNASIIYMSKENIMIPNENQCILASEIVEGYTKGQLSKHFTYENVYSLVVTNGDFEKIEERMKTQAKDWKELDRVLRGYKL